MQQQARAYLEGGMKVLAPVLLLLCVACRSSETVDDGNVVTDYGRGMVMEFKYENGVTCYVLSARGGRGGISCVVLRSPSVLP